MIETGDYTLNKEVVADAVKMVLGNTPVKVNSSVLMPPRGMDHNTFKDRIYRATVKAMEGESRGLTNPYWCEYRNVGGGKYALVYRGELKLDKKGNTIVINPDDARDVSDEDIRKHRKGEIDKAWSQYMTWENLLLP